MSRRRRTGTSSAIALLAAGIAAATFLYFGNSPLDSRTVTSSAEALVDAGLALQQEDGGVSIDPSAVAAALGTVPVDDVDDDGYDRDLFGQAWADIDRNGCDTRNDILGRDLAIATFKPGTRDCKVIGGTIVSPYTSEEIDLDAESISELVDIDHVVPLSWAWSNGADAWPDERRLQFANDPINLQAADASSNSSKSDKGPAEWMPPNAAYSCEYVARFTHVLDVYELTVTVEDRDAISDVLEDCE